MGKDYLCLFLKFTDFVLVTLQAVTEIKTKTNWKESGLAQKSLVLATKFKLVSFLTWFHRSFHLKFILILPSIFLDSYENIIIKMKMSDKHCNSNIKRSESSLNLCVGCVLATKFKFVSFLTWFHGLFTWILFWYCLVFSWILAKMELVKWKCLLNIEIQTQKGQRIR